ncbi:NUDIX hydrolase [Clostridium sp. KNHs214]|uniref:NUDIX hydrolase n=1 Tax=Clostridium sp. KNHs214 TaxID=1540257 RepID=UPI00068DA137|nr:NUDIX hydrolase [Clostridium sp. KNHs214]
MKEKLKKIIKPYKENYIREIRKNIRHAPLMTTACGVIIENSKGEILLQQRKDNKKWGIPGGVMEIGEKYVDVAKREVFEEVGIEIENLCLFGIYSGEDRIIVYPNNDICCVTSIVFKTTEYKGEILQETDETLRHIFFNKDNLPEEINEFDKNYIEDWKRNINEVIVN